MAISYFTTFRELFFLVTHPALWGRTPLEPEAMPRDPFDEFDSWYRRASRQWFAEFPNAMVLSTVSKEGQPQGRVVLLKGRSREGLVFYTNKQSQKGESLTNCPKAALTFYWGALQRQIRVEGTVEDLPDETSDAYFQSRPRASQIGAWASEQSCVLDSREDLLARVREMENKYQGTDIPRPEHWGGYRLVPHMYEFWELRLSRLHDRIRYTKVGQDWEKKRLAP
jgi:pyridoxamine 5'-phosphate oxidase